MVSWADTIFTGAAAVCWNKCFGHWGWRWFTPPTLHPKLTPEFWSPPPVRGCLAAVDNTFATPYLQQPLKLGADLVVHSTTKYMGGHSDVVGGALIARQAAHLEPIRFLQNAVGSVPGPMDCYLVQRGLKTLALRMEKHCANAQRIAEEMAGWKQVAEVIYPGLESHRGHAVASRQMRAFGGMVTIRVHGGEPAARRFCSKLSLFACAESLGGVESLCSHPATRTTPT